MAKLRARIDHDPETMAALTRKLNAQAEFCLDTENYKRPKSATPLPLLEPWYQVKSFSICHTDKLTDEIFSRAITGHLKDGYKFLIPYYQYFITLDGDPDPREQ